MHLVIIYLKCPVQNSATVEHVALKEYSSQCVFLFEPGNIRYNWESHCFVLLLHKYSIYVYTYLIINLFIWQFLPAICHTCVYPYISVCLQPKLCEMAKSKGGNPRTIPEGKIQVNFNISV